MTWDRLLRARQPAVDDLIKLYLIAFSDKEILVPLSPHHCIIQGIRPFKRLLLSTVYILDIPVSTSHYILMFW